MKTTAEITEFNAEKAAEFNTEPVKQPTYEQMLEERERARAAYKAAVLRRLREEEEFGFFSDCEYVDY